MWRNVVWIIYLFFGSYLLCFESYIRFLDHICFALDHIFVFWIISALLWIIYSFFGSYLLCFGSYICFFGPFPLLSIIYPHFRPSPPHSNQQKNPLSLNTIRDSNLKTPHKQLDLDPQSAHQHALAQKFAAFVLLLIENRIFLGFLFVFVGSLILELARLLVGYAILG